MHPDDVVVLHQRVVRRGVGDPAAGEADDEQPALPGDDPAGGVEGVAADRVVDDVGAPAVGEVLHGRDQGVADGPVQHDHVIRAEPPGHLGLVRRPDRGDDPGPRREPELHGGRADPARGRVHEQGLPRAQRRAVVQRAPAGLVGHEEPGGLGRRHALRPRVPRAQQRLLRVAAVGHHGRAEQPFPRRGVHPGHLQARGERQRRLVLVRAAAVEDVGEVDRRGLDPHHP